MVLGENCNEGENNLVSDKHYLKQFQVRGGSNMASFSAVAGV